MAGLGFGERVRSLCIVIAGIVLFAAPAIAETWDAASGFSQTSNPSGAWTYGYQTTIGGTLTKFDTVASPITGIASWCKNSGVDLAGNVDKNVSSAAVDTSGIRFEVGQLCFHPGPTGEKAVVRWTAPRTVTVIINALFTGQDYGAGTTTDIHVLKNNVVIYNGTINGFAGGGSHAVFGSSPAQSFNVGVTVAAGETIDFVAGDGGNGFTSDLVGLSATITVFTPVTKTTIVELRSLADDTAVSLTSPKAVTAASATFSDGSYYIEEPTRISGIKVIPPSGAQAVVLENRITLSGVIGTDANGERVFKAGSIDSVSSGSPIGPLAMRNSVAASSGRPDASGLLVRVFGWATCKSPDGGYVYVDDSSSSKDATGNTGVRVMLTGLGTALTKTIVPDQYVVVTGIVGSMRDGNNVIRVIRPRGDADITILTVPSDGMNVAKRWIDSNFGPRSARKPFSFVYDGLPSTSLLPLWQFNSTSSNPDTNRTLRTLTYTDPTTGLEVRCVETEYSDYPAVEWVVYFKNNGSADTPILENVKALNSDFWGGATPGDFLLNYNHGCNQLVTDFKPEVATLGVGSSMSLGCEGGRSSSALLLPPETDRAKSVGVMPFFNLQKPDGSGIITAVGWSGQWNATFNRIGTDAVNVQAGMELTHLKLHPGEEIRTPSIVMLFWSGGDKIVGHNQWRRLILDHYSPTPNGARVVPPIAASPHGVIGFTDTTEANMIQGINNCANNHLPIDTWWIDAGWYSWWNMAGVAPWNAVGTWEPDPARYPNGMKPVADAAHARGFKFLLWFEVERAVAGSWIANNHPDWLLQHSALPPDLAYQEEFQLVNFGNPAALAWAKDKFSKMVHDVGIDIYRIDLNMDPLYYWRNNEPSDRQGINEIKHIMGWYDYLDTLVRENPGLIIDNCAGGGRRLDIEMIKRSVSLTPSDYLWDPVGQQAMNYSLSMWFPWHGIGGITVDSYSCHSGMLASFVYAIDIYNSPTVWAPATSILNQYKSIRRYYSGDFYPLSAYTVDPAAWIAWQFDRADLSEGLVQAFRRSDSTVSSSTYKLRALDASAWYLLTNMDTYETSVMTGSQLMQIGLTVPLPTNGSAVIKYRRL